MPDLAQAQIIKIAFPPRRPYKIPMKIAKTFSVLFIALIQTLPLSLSASEFSQKRLQEFFKDFENDSYSAMAKIPVKYNHQGRKVSGSKYFSVDEISHNDFLDQKDELRSHLCRGSSAGEPCQKSFATIFQAMGPSGQISYFLENSKIVEINALSDPKFASGKPLQQPWSGDYWPTYRGGIAARYADASFPKEYQWKDYDTFFTKMLKETNYREIKELDTLSPAEKYDLLIGDSKLNLTQYSIQNSKLSVDEKGEIEGWFGLCHGWAPASFMMKRPIYPVEVKLDETRNLKFFPDDLKALTTLLWANGKPSSHFVGGRCNQKNPKRDLSGRVIDNDCWDVNPATFHLIMLNQMGADQRSLVMDATYDYEVWNQPISSYSIQYYNPQTKKTDPDWKNNLINTLEYTKDPFKKFRAPQTAKIIGVQMSLAYVVERNANHQEVDTEKDDNLMHVDYYYDLEINAAGEIVGGEWYQNAHPDFLWSPGWNSVAQVPGEVRLTTPWNGDQELPQEYKDLGVRASAVGLPLNKILSTLIERSQKP